MKNYKEMNWSTFVLEMAEINQLHEGYVILIGRAISKLPPNFAEDKKYFSTFISKPHDFMCQ